MLIALFQAIENQDLNLIASLLSNGTNPNILYPEFPGWTPLDHAIEQLEDGGSIEAIILLLRHGASVNIWDANHDATPLLMALFRGQIEAVRLLLAVGADPNVVGSEGDSPLRWCVEQGDYETAAMLLRCGATKTIDNAGGMGGMTALGIAAKRLDLKMIELLLQAGANPQVYDADKLTPYQRLPQRNKTEDDVIWLAAAALLSKD
ncbi:MAG TPA: hypothetical protein DDZ80_27815 [Cyanobacteria bacterium UBA8803]|nr:hypothetical protein [Cyanobacteria bacterium UBA9273]HBL62075.1 hypothetical protein [Cyanobacteria bacterium UBA8803]